MNLLKQPNIYGALRSVQFVVALVGLGYLAWRFTRGQHFGSVGLILLLVISALGVIAEVVRRRNSS